MKAKKPVDDKDRPAESAGMTIAVRSGGQVRLEADGTPSTPGNGASAPEGGPDREPPFRGTGHQVDDPGSGPRQAPAVSRKGGKPDADS